MLVDLEVNFPTRTNLSGLLAATSLARSLSHLSFAHMSRTMILNTLNKQFPIDMADVTSN